MIHSTQLVSSSCNLPLKLLSCLHPDHLHLLAGPSPGPLLWGSGPTLSPDSSFPGN